MAQENISDKLAGKILLQVEKNGEAWYVNPGDQKRYYLGRPIDAFNLMRYLGVGVTNDDLSKIPIGIMSYDDKDNDGDGLTNRFENAIGTDLEKQDTDNDGYNDKEEIENNYNPLNAGLAPISNSMILKSIGKILLQIEKNGEAWYVNPGDQKRYYLGRPADAFEIMKSLSLGIKNSILTSINVGHIEKEPEEITPEEPPICTNCDSFITTPTPEQIMAKTEEAILSNDTSGLQAYYSPHAYAILQYNCDYLDKDGRKTMANNFFNSKATYSANNKTIYSINISHGGWEAEEEYVFIKQDNGNWIISN